MLKTYSFLYDSMIAWYREWYPNPVHQRLMASLVMALMLFLNALSVVGVFAALGNRALFTFFFASPVVPFCLFAIMVISHLGFGIWRSNRTRPTSMNEIQTHSPRKIAGIYMIVSTLAFLSTMAWVGIK